MYNYSSLVSQLIMANTTCVQLRVSVIEKGILVLNSTFTITFVVQVLLFSTALCSSCRTLISRSITMVYTRGLYDGLH